MVTHTQGIINHLFIIIYYDCESGTNVYYVNQELMVIMVGSYFPMIQSGMVKIVLEVTLPVVLLLRWHGFSRC